MSSNRAQSAADARNGVGRGVTITNGDALRIAIILFTIAGIVAAYSGTLHALWRVWTRNENYSHGFLIPPISAWLVWRERDALRRDATAGSWRGLILLAPAILLQLIGLRGDVVTIQGLSFVMVVAGIVWHLYGGRVLLRAGFPIAFLLFMIPTLPWFVNTISFKLKILAARNAVAIAHVLGIAVRRDGVNLIFPGGTLAVENACSGLRSLVALMALGALFAYMARGALWKRAVLFALALPIAVLANTLRISALCVYAGLGSVGGAAGTFHDVGAYALFAVAFLLLAGSRKVLRC